jgi:hypothetical protein
MTKILILLGLMKRLKTKRRFHSFRCRSSMTTFSFQPLLVSQRIAGK